MPRNIGLKPLLLPVLAAASLAGCVTPGVTAAVHRDPAAMKRVLDRPDHGNEDIPSLMSNSIQFDCGECVKLLLKSGAKADAAALSAAALAGREDIARQLIGAGADPAAAMAVVHAQTRTWIGGAGRSPQEAQGASDLFKKLERERDAASDAAAPPTPAAPAPASEPPAAEAKAPAPRLVPSFHEEKRPDDYALIVGVEAYENLPAAAFARRDAEAAADFVKALGVPASHVAVLKGPGATLAGLAKNIEGWLAENVDANSTVYFYFSGRGAPDPKSGRAYLVPFDGDPRYLEQTAYPLKRLYAKLGALPIKRGIVILDAGFSGVGVRSAALPGGAPAAAAAVDAGFNSTDGKLALLAAADGDGSAAEDAAEGHGLFTYHLLNGLNGAAKDASGEVTLKSLFDFAKPKVVDGARRAGLGQAPLYESGGIATDRLVLRGK